MLRRTARQDITKKEELLKAKQELTALSIEKAMAQDLKDEPPPKMPSEKDMKDPQKMQEYMLQVVRGQAIPPWQPLAGCAPENSLCSLDYFGADGRVLGSAAA